MKRVAAARPRISERTWFLLILPLLWLTVLALGHAMDAEAPEEPATITHAGKEV